MPIRFSRETLKKFEDASASIPLRQIDRVFNGANVQLGTDSGGLGGDRRTQFRRYVASVDQDDSEQLRRLGDALAALIDEVADSKQEFLVNAAALDGFVVVNGVFRAASTGLGSFAVTCVEDLACMDDRGRMLNLYANARPAEAIVEAKPLVESVCRTVLRLLGKPVIEEAAGFAGVTESTLKALESISTVGDNAHTVIIRGCLHQLHGIVACLDGLRSVGDLSPLDARLFVRAALTVATYVAEKYMEQSGPSGE